MKEVSSCSGWWGIFSTLTRHFPISAKFLDSSYAHSGFNNLILPAINSFYFFPMKCLQINPNEAFLTKSKCIQHNCIADRALHIFIFFHFTSFSKWCTLHAYGILFCATVSIEIICFFELTSTIRSVRSFYAVMQFTLLQRLSKQLAETMEEEIIALWDWMTCRFRKVTFMLTTPSGSLPTTWCWLSVPCLVDSVWHW